MHILVFVCIHPMYIVCMDSRGRSSHLFNQCDWLNSWNTYDSWWWVAMQQLEFALGSVQNRASQQPERVALDWFVLGLCLARDSHVDCWPGDLLAKCLVDLLQTDFGIMVRLV